MRCETMCFLLLLLLLLLLRSAHTEPVITQGNDRLILMDGSNPCEGFVGIYHDGQLGYVGHKSWSNDVDNVVCRSTQCGEPVRSSTETAPWPIDKVWLNEVSCTGKEDHLWDCRHPGWGVSYFQMGSLRRIQCSSKVQMGLDGFKCAGAVRFSTDGGNTYSGYVCDKNWGLGEANLLCKNLDCGRSKEPLQQLPMVWKSFSTSQKITINCSGMKNVTHLWQCATDDLPSSCLNPASVTCTDFEELQLKGNTSNVCSGRLEKLEDGVWSPVKTSRTSPAEWCQQMHCGTNVSHTVGDNDTQLRCSDNVKVVVMDNNKPSRCYGVVHIQVNDSRMPVCATTWTAKEAEVVCTELNCGSVTVVGRRSAGRGIMDNVKCSGNESSLWHCSAKHDANRLSCVSSAYVVCADSVKVRLMDGPGKCAGRVEIQYEGRWRRVRDKGWTDDNSAVVCRQVGCGNIRNPTSPEKFFQGSGEFLAKNVKCRKNAKDISSCIRGNSNILSGDQAVGITCEEHKMVILKGNDSCSGMVGIKYNDKTYWLSGSKETWNQESADTVCQQMHCGKASLPTNKPNADPMKDVWGESYRCLPNTKSLLDCEKHPQPSDHNKSIATVNCSGKLKVGLTERCWGNVSVCGDDKKCGSVCADAWTKDNSVMLCKNLGCGDTVLEAITKPEESKAFFTSLHCSEEVTDLAQCNFVSNENNVTCKPAYVVCSGSVRSRFSDTRDKCSGNVEVHYEGQWLPVCKDALEDKTQNLICGEQCGQIVREIDYFGPKPAERYVISQIRCPANGEESLTACKIEAKKRHCDHSALLCSNWRRMALTLRRACGGAVFVHSQDKISAVSIEGWTETEGERLCQDLKCGKFKSNNTTTSASLWTTSFSCAGGKKPENIWECEKQTSPSQQNNTKQQLLIECQDEPKVTLSKTCHGEVRINDIEVCASHWNNNYSQLVCQALNCSNAIPDSFAGKEPSPDKQYFHVSCEDNHYGLGQCERLRERCDGRLVSIYCVGKVEFSTTETCGGQIEVNYRDRWEKVCPLKSFPPELKDSLCEGCSDRKSSFNKTNHALVHLETTLTCARNTRDIKYCVRDESCDEDQPAEIYCDGYVVPTVEPPEPTPIPRVYIIVGVGLVLVLVVLIVIFIRICIVKKYKNLSSRMLPRKDEEFESGDYDDVTSKANEMEVLSHGRFRSETEVMTENDARSTSSFPYDDIDNVAVAQPLTSEAAAPTTAAAIAAASGDNDIREDALDQSADGVVYEVEHLQQHHEDTEARIIQTEAEVHDSPPTTPDSGAAPPPGPAPGDEDYLVPGRDG